MSQWIRQTIVAALIFFSAATVLPGAAQDRAIHQTLRFARGTSHAELHKHIVRGTSHVYHFRARRGQYLAAILKTGPHTSFTIYSIKSGQIEKADGVTEWDGKLPETGEYFIEIGTDRSADYVLIVSIENGN